MLSKESIAKTVKSLMEERYSCGDITPLLKLIRDIPEIELLHIGPWTSLEAAARIFKNTPLEKCLHPVRDVQNATKEEIEHNLKGLIRVAKNASVTIRADGIQVLHSLKQDLEKVKLWISIAQLLAKPDT